MPQITGWLHEVRARDWGVDTYWLTGKSLIHAFYPFTAEFFIAKTDQETRKQILSHPHVRQVKEVSRYLSIHDWKTKPVLCVRVNPYRILSTYHDLREYWGEYLFNADLSVYQQFCFQTKLFPYVYANIEIQNGKLQNNWELLESYTQMDYRPVPFRTLWLQPIFEDPHFIERENNRITSFILRRSVINQEEEPVVFEKDTEANLIIDCIDYIQKVDPDILFTRGGDTFIPVLANHAVKAGIRSLSLGRGSRPLQSYVRPKEGKKGYERYKENRGHSFMSYGRVYFAQYGVYLDGGRHHYDVGNSFMWKDGNIEGIHELVRIGCSDPQRIARGTIGTTLTAVQMRTAYYRNILIPPRKADAESFRPAWSMMSDVGGLVFSPIVGFHANVTELDFLSMYPNIMVHRNVSPETVNCDCCAGKQLVPLTDYHICTQRPGLVSLSLENILERRAYFKARRNHSLYDRRQKVLKWLLVCCFTPDTIVPILMNEELKLVQIGPFIDKLLDENKKLENINVVGVNKKFKAIFNPIKGVFRLNSPSELYRIRLETGREFTVTGDHICFVLKDGQFQEQFAAKIKEGDFLPVIFQLPEIIPQTEINVIPIIFDESSEDELDKWRIKGQGLSNFMESCKTEIKNLMKGHHSDGAIRSWLLNDFIPFRYFSLLKIPKEICSEYKIGYGRRVGGKIHWLPSRIMLDKDLAFFLGYFVGDGSARKSYLRLSVNASDVDLVSWFENFIQDRFGLETHIRKETHAKMFTLQINSTALIWILRKVLGVASTRAQGKHKVPSLVLNGSEDFVYGFISGLIASDGDVSSKRNIIKINSTDLSFIEELAYLTGRLGLYTTIERRIPKEGGSMFSLSFSGKETLNELLNKGLIKQVDKAKITSMQSKIRSRARAKDLPVVESKLLDLARKVRTVRQPRISDRVRVSRIAAKDQVQRIKERSTKLSSEDLQQLKTIEDIINGDLGFAKVVEIKHVRSRRKFVYCFEVTKEYHGFAAGTGGIVSHNCFGYQGYRNARFGRIEAHETISAYGRHALTLTHQLAANLGLDVVAGIVDSIWLKQPDGQPVNLKIIEKLCQQIEEKVNLPVEHTADYHWIVFLPRRHEPGLGVLNRYYGLKRDGKFKIRGIEIRQSSSPLFVKEMQHKLLEILAKARTRAQFRTQLKRANQIMQSYLTRLERGKIPLEKLLVTIRPSRAPEEYVSNTRQAIAALQLAKSDVKVEPGMKLCYLITDALAKDPMKRVKVTQLLTGDEQYDIEEYRKLCIRAYESLIPSEFEEKALTLELFLSSYH
ncbi:MAG: DNA polymerase domain-containing protein [Candidatus Hodarchaeota archaeon]